MKEKFRKALLGIWIIPIPVLVMVMVLLNYFLGLMMSNINQLYSQVQDITKEDFLRGALTLVGIWIVLKCTNSYFTRTVNHRILDSNYMKWIEKLTYSKVSSITSLGTGGLHNAIQTIASCDKGMVITFAGALPFIAPFVMMNVKEYKIAGILPVIVNIVTIGCIVGLSFVVSNLKSNKISAEAGASLHSVTVDCIHNSKTVKYFNKENWSVDKQQNKQKEVFVDFLNLPKVTANNMFNIIGWIPTIVNVMLCWEDKSVVLFVLMSDYALECISGSIVNFMDYFSEKKANIKILGSLEPDDMERKSMKAFFNIKHVEFKYSPESKVTFFIDDLLIVKSHRYCVTGKSGFGKSTLIKLLTGTVEPTEGTIDKYDCVYMFAESEMFNTSVFENIALGDTSVTEDEVRTILNNLSLELDMDIMKDSVGEKGCNLSTGQMQRINLARVVVYARRHPNAIVALDEVTSALDEVTSIQCINYITEEFKRLDTTLLYVSNKSDYKDTDLITDNIYVEKLGNSVGYWTKK